MNTEPLQTGLMILGELSKGLMFSLLAVGDVCLASWTRHSFAKQRKKNSLTPSIKKKKQPRRLNSSESSGGSIQHCVPSPDGEVTMLGAGLAAVGEGADVGVAAFSTEAVPVCGDGREEEPAEAPPMLFCRGERGLWAAGRKEKKT